MQVIDRVTRVNVRRVVSVLVLGLALAKGGFSQESELNAAARAYQAGDWNTVINLLENTPSSQGAERLLGLAHYQQQDLDRALPLLRRAAQNNPSDAEVNRALLNALIAERDYTAANNLLAGLSTSDNEYNLARARIALAEGDSSRADALYRRLLQAPDSNRAQEAAAEYIEHLQASQQYAEAYEIAQQALARDPDSFLSYRFRQINDPAGETSAPPPDNWTFTLGYRFEYDDNVALLPDSLAPGTVDEDDFRHVLTADVLYRKKLPANWQVFAEARGSQSIHHEASEFNFTRLNGLVGTGQSFDRWGWRVPAEISHDRFDGDSFSTTFTVSPGAYVRVLGNFYTHVYGRYANSNFDQVAFPEDDRSAEVLGGGLLLAGNLTQRWSVRAIAEYLDYAADGSNWDREEWQAYLYTEYALTSDWAVGGGARYTDIDFDNLIIPFLSPRADESWEYYLSATHRIAPAWFIRAQVTYIDHQSSLPAFDYERVVASLGLSWRF